MSQLTQLKQRIKVVTNLQKITHAMQLTSMSTHARLLKKTALLAHYKQSITHLLHEIAEPTNATPLAHSNGQELVIIVGSQKGLCGVFNTRLLNLYEQTYGAAQRKPDIITIGKKIDDYFKQNKQRTISSYNDFTPNNFIAIAHELILFLMNSTQYSKIIFFSNHPRTFFVQESHATIITPPHVHAGWTIKPSFEQTCMLEEPLQDLLYHLVNVHVKASLEELLFKSLIAEQAARFVSMDSSTRNADQLLTDMNRDYNKLRQNIITRELTDLAGGML